MSGSLEVSLGVAALLALACTFLPARHGVASLEDATATVSPRAGAAGDAAPEPLRVGLVFDVGGRGDKSFNDAAYEGLLRAHRELGAGVAFLEPQGSEDREAALRLFAARGVSLVLGVGFIFSSDIDDVARAYPGVRFACLDYAGREADMPKNVAGLVFRSGEGAFLVGAVAGSLSKTQHVGFVGGMQNPLISVFERGYARGVKHVCPACVVHAGYAGTSPEAFRDPAKGEALGVSMISAGADVLFHASGATGHGVFEAAKEARVLAIGVDADQHDEMPGTVVTSLLKRGDVAVFEVVRQVKEGRFAGGMHVFGVKDGAIDYVREGPHAAALPADVKARVDALRDELARGALTVPE